MVAKVKNNSALNLTNVHHVFSPLIDITLLHFDAYTDNRVLTLNVLYNQKCRPTYIDLA